MGNDSVNPLFGRRVDLVDDNDVCQTDIGGPGVVADFMSRPVWIDHGDGEIRLVE